MTQLSTEILQRLEVELRARGDPERAGPMTAYMKGQFAFLGVQAAPRVAALRAATAGLQPPDESDLEAFARACWLRPQRKFQYCAVAYLRRHVEVCSADFLNVA